MKKTFVILTIVLAMLAAPVFAEVTASGEANFAWMFNADDYEEQIDTNDVVLDLGGTVGEYTSISAEFEAEYDTDGFVSDRVANGANSFVQMNQLTITQDVTGALGIDAGVSAALTVGIDDFDPMEYNDMAYGDFDLDGELNPGTVMTKVSLGFQDMVTVDAAFYEEGMGVNAYGNVADMVDVSAYYMMDFDTIDYDYSAASGADEANVFGANAAIMAMDGLKLGAGFEMASWDSATDDDYYTAYGLSVVYTGVEATTLTLGTSTKLSEGSDDFMKQTSYRVAADYMVNDMISVNAAMGADLDNDGVDFADAVVYEAGAKAAVDGVTYQAGYTMYSDNEAKTGEFKDGADRAGNFYLKMSASF